MNYMLLTDGREPKYYNEACYTREWQLLGACYERWDEILNLDPNIRTNKVTHRKEDPS